MIDSHTHLDSLQDPNEAVERAKAAGVTGVVSIGCGADSIRRTLEIADRHPGFVQVAAGIHPQAASTVDLEDEWAAVSGLARDPRIAAIGETGFDQFRDYGPIERQHEVFELHCGLARSRNLPLVIHTRAAEQHTLDALRQHASDLRVILHCYSLVDHVADVLRENWWCSFAGNVTYPRNQDLREAAARIPADRLLVETDAPYLTPVPHRGTRNEPSYVVHTADVIASVRGLTTDELRHQVTANAIELFGAFAPVNVAP